MATTKKKASASKSTRASKSTSSAKTSRTTKSASAAKTMRKPKGANLGIRRLKSTSWVSILEALVIGAFGVLILMDADKFQTLIFYVIGIFLMVKGAYKVVNYFAMHGRNDFYNNDLFYGVVALILGIMAVVLSDLLGEVVAIMIGAWMIYDALVRLNIAIKLHAAGVKEWFYILIFALVMMALGIYAIIAAGDAAVMQYLGIAMIAVAVFSIFDDVIFIRNLDKLEG